MDSHGPLVSRPTVTRYQPDFEQHKVLIEELYLRQRKPLRIVRKMMEERHGFTATKYQYERFFGDSGWSKNVPSYVWDAVCLHLYQRATSGDKFDVYYYGERMKPEKLCREMKKRSSRMVYSDKLLSLPQGMAIVPSRCSTSTTLTQNLPYDNFAKFDSTSILLSRQHPPEVLSNLTVKRSPHAAEVARFRSEAGTQDVRALSQYQMWPSADQHSQRSEIEASIETPGTLSIDNFAARQELPVPVSLWHQKLLFTSANNFAGLKTADIHQVVQSLRGEAYQHLHRLLQETAHTYTTRAIIYNLFRASIEAGNPDAVSAILGQFNVPIDVDALIRNGDGIQFTPIELATRSQKRDVVRVLLDHGADPNIGVLTPGVKEYRGAADCLFRGVDIMAHACDHHLDCELLELLMSAGAQLSSLQITRLRYIERSERIALALIKHTEFEYAEWIESGDLGPILWKCDEEDYLLMTEALYLSYGAAILHDPTPLKAHSASLDSVLGLLNLAAVQGFAKVIDFLLQKGAQMTLETLQIAIAHANQESMSLCLRKLLSTQWTEESKIDILSSIICLGEAGRDLLQDITEGWGFWDQSTCKSLSTSWKLACEAGCAQMYKHLLDRGFRINPFDMGQALVLAIQDGREVEAKLLIDLGANTSPDVYRDDSSLYCKFRHRGNPLVEALKARNMTVLRQLLDAHGGFDVFSVVDDESSVISLVVEWGDLTVIQLLLDAGLRVGTWDRSPRTNSFLSAAVVKSDLRLIRYLIQAGADVNEKLDGRAATALALATRIGDYEVVRCLLESGADPADDDALAEAVITGNFALGGLLLRYNKARYVTSHQNLGGSALGALIEAGDFSLFCQWTESHINLKKALSRSWEFGLLFKHKAFKNAIKLAGIGDLRFLGRFLQHGCSPELRLTPEKTAFLAGIETKSLNVVKLFVKHNADVNFPPQLGLRRTPLQMAAEVGNAHVVQFLINSGADVDGPPAERGGGTALQLAAIEGHHEIVIMLLSHAADVNALPSKVDGRTALQGASEHGRLDTVKILLNAGAAFGGSDLKEIEKAISYADGQGFPHTGDLIRDHFQGGTQYTQLMSSGSVDPLDEFVDWSYSDDMVA